MEDKINNLKRSFLTLISRRHRPRARVPAPAARHNPRPVARPPAPEAPRLPAAPAHPSPRLLYTPGRYLSSPWRQIRAGHPLFRIG